MKRLLLLLALVLPATAHAFTVSGRFLYEDRLFDGNGYTGAVQNLPIRHVKVEAVDAVTQQTLASGVTGADGRYALSVTGQLAPVSLFVRATTDGRAAGYQIRVVDNFVRVPTVGLLLTASQLYSISTATTLAHSPATDLAVGDYLIQDADGTGVAQAFNIFDCGVDFFDWVGTVAGAIPDSSRFLVYAWKATGTPGNPPPAFGSNYSQQGIFIGADPNPQSQDTDGWSDTVILHETGHWYDDMYSRSDNPGGTHYIGDNDADVLLAYGEGSATFHCAKVREWRATHRTNLSGQPIDRLVSLYADLLVPPPVGTPGGLSFGYDFETGNYSDTGAPIGQRGSANETNVTSALWDMCDGPSTPDATPGVDDEPFETSDAQAYGIEHDYMRNTMSATNALTVEDYYQGWFFRNGAGYQKAALDAAFMGNQLMPWYPDAYEPDGTLAQAKAITPVAYATHPGGKVVINEIELGAADAIELMNTGDAAVDLTGWQLEVFANGTTQDPTRIYTFPPFTLEAGEAVAVHEGDDQTFNGQYHLYAGDRTVFNASWNPGLDGACELRDATQNPVDFVRWRDANGVDNGTATPAGLAYSGFLDSPAAPNGLARDVNGTDTDQASDWHSAPTTLGSVNHPSPQAHTIFDAGDQDVVKFTAVQGQRYGFEARCDYSATDTKLEVLSGAGAVIASNDNSDVSVRDSRVDFLASSAGTYYVRASHVGAQTDWGEYTLLAFARPAAPEACPAPGGLTATADHVSDVQDHVTLQWSNGAAYDSVHVYRNGTIVGAVPGNATSYQFYEARGAYTYGVSGEASCGETAQATDQAFAGLVGCDASDDFEDGQARMWFKDALGWGVTPMAKSGSWAFTDSPAGPYKGCPTGASGCNVEAIATFAVPADVLLAAGATLEWDQICITEHCEPAPCDRCLVEVSSDGGNTWTIVGAYDSASDPAWTDMVATPDDYRHASIDLSAYVNQRLLVRFRLESDSNLEFDGWYVDNVALHGCPVVGVDPSPAFVTFASSPAPNPLVRGGRVTFQYSIGADAAGKAMAYELHNVAGRLVRVLDGGVKTPGAHAATWNGTDTRGVPVPPGVYYAKFRVGGFEKTSKVVVIG